MKNFTPFGRLLLVAVFLLSAVGLGAQTVCGINGPVTISAEPACQGGFPSPQPFIVVDLGPGSGLINGPVNVRIQPIYNNIFPGPPVDALGVIANSGIIAFEAPDNSVFSAFNIKIRLIEITIVGSCTQNFQNSPIESAPFSMQEASGVQSITKNTTNSIDPPCAGIATGRISANLVPTSGPFTATRFRAEIFPSVAFVQVFGPSSGPNTDPNSYLIETTASLEAGEYDIVISDNQSMTGCAVVYSAKVGDPSKTLTALASSQGASCFGIADGSITVGVSSDIDPLVNGAIFVEYSFGNSPPIQFGQLPVNNNTNLYDDVTISNLATGTYQVNLTSSATGCNDDVIVGVSEPDEIMVTASADPVCADASTFDFTLTGVSGLELDASYRLIDASFFDPTILNNSCWSYPSTGFDPIAPGLQMDGSYGFTVGMASMMGCFDINQDTLVTLYLELLNPNPNGCRDTFSFPLQINAVPVTPAVDATADVGGSTINDVYCSEQDIDLDIADYDPAFTYEITYIEVSDVLPGGAAAVNDTFPYVDGSTVVSFVNNTNFLATIDFEVTKTNVTTMCTSTAGSFSISIRPEAVVDNIINDDIIVCSAEQFVSDPIEVNGSSNIDITYNYAWTLNNASADFTYSGVLTGNNASNTFVSGTFFNTTGSDQMATLSITPVFVQQSAVVGGGSVDNTCEGDAVTIDVTVTASPTLAYDLTIGVLDTTLTSGSVTAFEICNGEDFQLDNLTIAESNSGGLAKYVRYRVRGDARFLQINTNGSNFDLIDVQTTQFLAIDNFAIGQPSIQNNHPANNAQVAEIILTPYFEDTQNGPNFPLCAGQPVRLFLTVNPTPPTLPSPQADTVCSDERIEYTIMGASGSGSTLQTRITETNVFAGQTMGSFTVPEGADRIDNFSFKLTGGNGGSTTTTGGIGGFGGQVSGTLDTLELLPGDVVDIRKGLAGGANDRNGDGGDATILTVTRNGAVVYTFIAAGGGGAGSDEDGRNGRNFTPDPAADGTQGQGPGGFGGTGSPAALGGNGNVNGGGGGGGRVGGNGGDSQAGESGQGGASFRSTTLAPASFAQKTDTEPADGQVEIFYTVVYDDIRFDNVVVDFDANALTNVGEAIVNGEVDTILFGQQFVNNTNSPQDVTYTLTPVTQANCGGMSTIEVVVTIEPQPMATIASGSTTTVTGNAMGGFEATVCSGDPINAILNSLTIASGNQGLLYFEVSTATSMGTTTSGSNNEAASNSPDFDGDNSGNDLPIDFFETEVSNNTGVDGTITYTIMPYISNDGPNCQGTPIIFTVTVQPGFNVNTTQPQVNVCSREALNTVFDLDNTQSFLNTFSNIRVTGFRVTPVAPVMLPTADFTFTGLDTTGLAAGGFMLDRTGNFFNDAAFTNRTGGDVGVEFDVVFTSDTGCDSEVVTYLFNSRAEPIIDESNTAITICEGEATGLSVNPDANSAFGNSFAPNDVTFSYTLDEGAMTHTGNTYPVSGVDAFRFQNDVFDNPTSTPQTATYTVVATSRFGCASQPVTYIVVVEPQPELVVTASQGASSIMGETLAANFDTLTICSGSFVDFALTQDVTGTDVSYRIVRDIATAPNVTGGNMVALEGFEGGLAIGGFTDTLNNDGVTSGFVRYALRAYTFGRDAMDGNGVGTSDDCLGPDRELWIEVLPATTDESVLAVNLAVNTPNAGTISPGNGAQVCDNSEVLIRPVTTIDPTTGAAFIWRRENDGTLLGGAVSGSGGFLTMQNINNVYPAPNADRIQQVLTAEDDATTEVRYIVTLYSFGTDGINDMLASGSDDCTGDIDTVTVQLDPTPQLSYDLEIGTAPAQRLDETGSPYVFEICSGEDFLISNLDIPELADGKFNYVQLRARGDVDFLGLPTGGTFIQVAPAGNFSLGAQNVQTTSGSNSAQTARIRLIPYFEDGNDTNSRSTDECAGETIVLIVTLNPTPDVIAPASVTFCSDELTEFAIPTSGNNFRSRVAQTEDFSASNDYVVPPGVFSIRDINIMMTGGNGGSSNGALRGGLGGKFEIELGNNQVEAGDTIRVRKGNAGAGDVTFGNGGDATLLCVIAGSDRGPISQGDLIETFVAAGGGGAGQAFTGEDANVFSADSNNPSATDGAPGLGLGGFGGTGWDANDPASGSLGGNGRGNGGGGGGGWAGGDGGANTSGMAGDAGTSYSGSISMINPAFFSTKDFSDTDAGEVVMDFTLVYDEVVFTLVNRAPGTGLVDLSDDPLAVGDSATDTILFGERFENPTDEPIDVVYTFSTSSEANCPGSEVVVTLTIEPNPTLDFAGNGTMVSDDGNNNYSAAICSGDGISATVSSDVIPSLGASFLRARVITTTSSTGMLTFGNNPDAASQTTFFNGNNQPSVADVDFFEDEVSYSGADTATVTYQIIPVIIGSSFSGAECFGDTITFTVSIYPGFLNEEVAPMQVNVCSNVSLYDAGFDVDDEQVNVLVAYDSIIIDTVYNDVLPANAVNFDTISSVYSGTPATVIRSEGFFGADIYRNRTGGPVIVSYEVRLVAGPACTSGPITYRFRYTAEPVIDTVETVANQIDTTVCNGATTGLEVFPAANSAYPAITGANAFQNQITIAYAILDQPMGLALTKGNGTYPATAGRNYMKDDVWTNTTAGPLEVKYTVNVSNGSCAGDSVVYTVTVNPNPFADVMLTSLDSTETFGLNNSLSVSPNPIFGVCSGQALTATVPTASTSASGMLMVNFEVSLDADLISGYPAGTTYSFPASELADSLSYAAGELVNTTNASQFFTVEYRAYIEANGTPGFQNDGVDCQSDGIIQFDVVVSPTNGAIARTELDGTPGVIPAGMDTLCSGDVYDFFVRNSDIAGIPVDSFLVEVTDAGLDAVTGTPTGSFIVQAPATPTNAVRLQDFSYTNTTPGIKTVTYIVRPFSGACEGTPDTTTISYRAEIDLVANESVICADPGIPTSLFAIDLNGGMLSSDPSEYRYAYIGGSADGYTLQAGDGSGLSVFVFDPATQANAANLVFEDQLSVLVTPSPNSSNFTPGTVELQVIYDDIDNGCGTITDTIILNFQTTAEAGMVNQALGILCDEVNFILSDAVIGGDPNGVFTFTNGDPGQGVLNGANFTPMVGGSDPAPVAIDFTYTVGGGNSGCATAAIDFTIMVEPAPNAGTYDGTIGEACEAALAYNLFDLLDGEMQNGTFMQTAGVGFVTANPDGTIDQDNTTPGAYEFSYEVMSANGCGTDMVTGIMVQVNSREDCSTFVPCDVISLSPGFNVISFDVISNDNAVETIFADLVASRNLLRVIAVNPDVSGGNPETFSYLSLIDDYVGEITGGIQGGYGYIVEVSNAATVEVCGTVVDPDLRVALKSRLNIVGYVPQSTESVEVYFDNIIAAGNLNTVRTVENGIVRNRVYGVFPFPVGPLTTMQNGFGYIIDVDAAYANGSWRDNEGIVTTSYFDQFYGVVDNGEEYVGETIQFVDDLGNVYGETFIREGGIYYNAFAFGDVEATEDETEGFTSGAPIFAMIDGQRYQTGAVFGGSWEAKRMDLDLPSGLTPVFEETVPKFSLNASPNPTTGFVTVDLSFAQSRDIVSVEVFNVYGQLVATQKLEGVAAGRRSLEVDFTNLPSGAYHLRVMAAKGLLGNRQVIRR